MRFPTRERRTEELIERFARNIINEQRERISRGMRPLSPAEIDPLYRASGIPGLPEAREVEQRIMQQIEREAAEGRPFRGFIQPGPPPEPGTWMNQSREDEKPKKPKEEPKPIILNPYQPGQNMMEFIGKEIEIEKDPARIKWLKSFQQCVLPDAVRETIEEALAVVLLKDKFEAWGISEHFEKGITNSMLIYGPPGTGKTMIAEAIAAVLRKDLLKLDTGAIESHIPGQAERNITENFEQAKQKNAVVMFDECDSLLYHRDAVGPIISAQINHLLKEIERFDGVVLFTTNRMGKLDEALQRRIIAKIELGLPDKNARAQIWKNLIPSKTPRAENVSIDELSEPEIAGGDIKNAVLLGIRKAIAKNADKLDMDHLRFGLKSVLAAKDDYARTRPKAVAGERWDYAQGGVGVSRGVSRGRTMTMDIDKELKRTMGKVG